MATVSRHKPIWTVNLEPVGLSHYGASPMQAKYSRTLEFIFGGSAIIRSAIFPLG